MEVTHGQAQPSRLLKSTLHEKGVSCRGKYWNHLVWSFELTAATINKKIIILWTDNQREKLLFHDTLLLFKNIRAKKWWTVIRRAWRSGYDVMPTQSERNLNAVSSAYHSKRFLSDGFVSMNGGGSFRMAAYSFKSRLCATRVAISDRTNWINLGLMTAWEWPQFGTNWHPLVHFVLDHWNDCNSYPCHYYQINSETFYKIWTACYTTILLSDRSTVPCDWSAVFKVQ